MHLSYLGADSSPVREMESTANRPSSLHTSNSLFRGCGDAGLSEGSGLRSCVNQEEGNRRGRRKRWPFQVDAEGQARYETGKGRLTGGQWVFHPERQFQARMS